MFDSANLPVVTASIGTDSRLAVDARKLHGALAVGKDFSTWIKDRIDRYNFQENEDFIIFTDSGEKSGRGRPAIEYLLSLDMAKELCMVENNENGRLARKYFIACERALRSQALALPQDYSSALRALADEVDRRKQAELALTQTQEALVVAKQDALEAKSALGFAGEYVQVKGLSWVPSVFDITAKGFWGQLGKAFSAACRYTNMPWSEVPDPIYGSVRAYPRKLANRMESIFRTVQDMDDATFREKSFKSSLPGAILGMRRYMKKN